jgi:signal transduction histidine kinase
VLRPWHAILQGAWALLLYAGLGFGEWLGWITPHYPFLRALEPGLYAAFPYVCAAPAVLGCGVFGTLYFTLTIAARLDERERQLRDAIDALRTSQQAIADLQARRSRFMQTAAHQLKSPLAGIQTLTSLIRDDIVGDDEARRSTCNKIIQRCQSGIQQVTELLTLARIQEADPSRHLAAVVDVGEVTQELCHNLAPLAEGKNIRFVCHVPDSVDLRAHVDRRDLTNCISNLIENAIKYTPPSGEVTVSARRESLGDAFSARRQAASPAEGPSAVAYVALTVADTGMGINPESLDQTHGGGSVFDAFRRGNAALAAQIPGTGLGLSIVREVVEQAGGRIRVHSRPGKGSKFTVLLPGSGERPPERAVRDTRRAEIITEREPDDQQDAATTQETSTSG